MRKLDPERLKANRRRYYLKHKKKLNAYSRAYSRKHYKAYYQKNKTWLAKNNKEQLMKKKQWWFDYKSTLACKKCGESHPGCLVFHHINQNEKNINVTKLISNKERTLAEIKKCIVLCANCHRKLHYDNGTRGLHTGTYSNNITLGKYIKNIRFGVQP